MNDLTRQIQALLNHNHDHNNADRGVTTLVGRGAIRSATAYTAAERTPAAAPTIRTSERPITAWAIWASEYQPVAAVKASPPFAFQRADW